jgi:hypothetical protein
MIDRRDVLKLGAATVTGALVNGTVAAASADRIRRTGSLFIGIFDERFQDGAAFADALDAHGIVTTGVRGDVARLWYDGLRARLKSEPLPIAGLTDRAALFCLEELARDVGMRVAVRVDHLIDRAGHIRHDPTGPISLVEATQALDRRASFGRTMAVLASECALSGARHIEAQKRTGPSAPVGLTALATWVIA